MSHKKYSGVILFGSGMLAVLCTILILFYLVYSGNSSHMPGILILLLSMLLFPFLTVLFTFYKARSAGLTKDHMITKYPVLESIYLSSVFLFIGFFLGLLVKDHHLVSNGQLFLTILSAIYIIMVFGTFIYWTIKKDKIEAAYVNLTNKHSIQIEEFLETAKQNHANLLAVAGNLNGLKTDRGLNLLRSFLSGSGNETNVLELYIPKEARSNLRIIKQNFNDDLLSKRVKIKVIEPFVFLQGIVFAGSKANTDTVGDVSPKGYYLYKPIIKENDSYSGEGIFVDLSDVEDSEDYCITVASYYKHLNGDDYKNTDYIITPGIFNRDDKKTKKKYILETLTLADVVL